MKRYFCAEIGYDVYLVSEVDAALKEKDDTSHELRNLIDAQDRHVAALTDDIKTNSHLLAKQHDRNMELETNLSDYKVCVRTANKQIAKLKAENKQR